MKTGPAVTALTIGLALVLGGSPADAKKKKKAPEPEVVCPEAGTAVPFAKAMNPAFAKDYKGCSIEVEADFYASGAGMMVLPFETSDSVVFRAVPPGEKPAANALSGEGQAFYASIPKAASDVIFELKQGDKLKMTGGTMVEDTIAGGQLIMSWVMFDATSVKKAAPPAAAPE